MSGAGIIETYLILAYVLVALALGSMATIATVILQRARKRDAPSRVYKRGVRPIWPTRRK